MNKEKATIEVKEFELQDVFTFSKILDKTQIELTEKDYKGKTQLQLGKTVMFKMFYKLHLCEKEVKELIENISNVNIEKVSKIKFSELLEILTLVTEKNNLEDFFQQAKELPGIE